ncbi:hypothetical protein AB833_19225 [Chromatiales bacterium (ex Bugula neritina AB1)]|nr:hypothetical protein AB833_19225 [Chromatiales bacterium (ex Bugula neritina AB1)]
MQNQASYCHDVMAVRIIMRILLILFATSMFAVLPSIVFADSRLNTGPLPTTLIDTKDCTLTETYPWGGYGWDGEKTCKVTKLRFFGAEHTLSGTRTADTSIKWSRDDFANQTLRCDSYRLRTNFSAGTKEYSRSRYDITFLSDDAIPASATNEDLSNITAHIYTRGFNTGRTGILTGIDALVNFSAGAFATDKGYLFIEDRGERNANGDNIVEKFSHCWLRDSDAEDMNDTDKECIDTLPVGDGWGWDGVTSCRLKVSDPVCVDSPPVGDGWGWDGVSSCKI